MEPFRAPREAKQTTATVRRSARQTDKKTNDEPTVIPFRKGIKLMSQREADECARHGEVLRWSSDSDEDAVSKAKKRTVHLDSDTEEPTEFGVVWERYDEPVAIVIEREKDPSNAWSSTHSPSRVKDKDEAPPSAAGSPHLSEFEALLERLEHEKNAPKKGINLYASCLSTSRLTISFYFDM
jgi:hypothetical protein